MIFIYEQILKSVYIMRAFCTHQKLEQCQNKTVQVVINWGSGKMLLVINTFLNRVCEIGQQLSESIETAGNYRHFKFLSLRRHLHNKQHFKDITGNT